MTVKTNPELDPLELSIRARLGQLRPAEQHAFAQALESGAWLRLVHELGRDLDVLTRVRPGDEALVERAASRALASGRARPPRARSRVAFLLVAALVIASGAAATHAVFTRTKAPAARAVAVPPATQSDRATPRRASRDAIATPREPSPELEPAELEPATRTALPSERAAAPRGTEASPSTTPPVPRESAAATLFRRAGAARRAGSLDAARALYVELQGRFPESSEARVSRVSLGKLYLSAGRAREAELEFAKYLRAGTPDLREEALVGRADALFALGQRAEERDVWQELLRRHPASVYAARARKRLGTSDHLPPASSQ